MIGLIILAAIFGMLIYIMCIESFLNLIFKKGAPYLGFKWVVSAVERFRLARRVRHSSEHLEQEYQKSISIHTSGTLAGIGGFAVIILTGCILGALHVPEPVLLIVAPIELIGVIYFCNAKIRNKDKEEYEDGQLLKKCGKCKVVELYFYQIGKTNDCYATIRMPDGSEYRMIPVVNYAWEDTVSSRPVSKGIVYYRKLPFAKCCVWMEK